MQRWEYMTFDLVKRKNEIEELNRLGREVSLGLLDGHARVCMRADGSDDDQGAARVDELMGAIGRMLGR